MEKKSLVAILNHSGTSLQLMIEVTGMAFGGRPGSWVEEQAICSEGRQGRTGMEARRAEEWRAVYQLGVRSQ